MKKQRCCEIGYREAGPEECESDGTVLWTAGKSWVVKEVGDE